jgi:endonuclease/exonuclease/phosphatase family metal-dependent hydrolase
MLKSVAAFLALCSAASAVEIRVASFNVGALYLSGGPVYGLGDPGTAGYEATKEVLGRIDADIVALQEIHNADIDEEPAGTPEDVEVLAAALGYPYIYTPPRTSLDFTFRVIILSKYPFITTTSAGSPSGANEVTRRFPSVKVDVPGTNKDPVVISGHLKSGTTSADRFRRAVEMRRLNDHLIANNLTADDNFILVGDFNLSSTNRTFTEAPADLPGSYVLANDVTYPVTYSTNPLAYFSPTVPVKIDLRQLNGSNATFQSGSSIDLLLVSPAFAGRPLSSEIYNSQLDTSNNAGPPKNGSPLAAGTSATASDHFAIFADLELDADFPNLDLTVLPASVSEMAPVGTAKLRATIPATRPTAVTVQVTSDAPQLASTVSPAIVIPAGSLFAEVNIGTSRNFITDEGSSVAFTGSATNYDPDSAVLQVQDAEGSYTFTALNQTLTETFTGFDGTHSPAPWNVTGSLPWLGIDHGSSTQPGLRTYGDAANPSLGFLPDSADPRPTLFAATYRNQSPQMLDAISISMTARQWRAVLDGTPDRLTATVITPAFSHSVPALRFLPSTTLPTGAVPSPAAVPLTATVDGLAVAPGESFELRFTATPGSGNGALPADVFINEFHYDNAGTDTGEFVEVVVGPGYTAPLSALRLYLYNGNGGDLYNAGTTYTLDTFTLGSTTASGHRIFHRAIIIQNGNPDGFAITFGAQVLHFISYGGAFTATAGPAAGLTSVDTGFTQPDTTVANTNAIRLTGNGSIATDFLWAKSNIAHSPGVANEGQSFVLPSRAQGISVDDISVTFLPPDIDGDGDGFTNRIEQNLLLTDPANPSSKFFATANAVGPATSRLSFPTLSGRKYLVQSSTDLLIWSEGVSYPGTGSIRVVDFPITAGEPRKFHRVIVAHE